MLCLIFFCINDFVALFFMWPARVCACVVILLRQAHLVWVVSMSQNRSIEVILVIQCPSPIYYALTKSCRKSLLQKLLRNSLGGLCPGQGDHQPTSNRQLSPSASLSSPLMFQRGKGHVAKTEACCSVAFILDNDSNIFQQYFQRI